MKLNASIQTLLAALGKPLRRSPRHGICIAANDAVDDADFLAANEQTYDVEIEGVMVVPFGEVPVNVSVDGRMVRGLQRIDAEAGNQMAADMGGIMGTLKSAFMGRPIFVGHPYHPNATEAAKYPDKRARGFVKSVEVTQDSIRLIPKYNKLGKEEVEDQQLIYHTPQWRMKKVMDASGRQEIKNGLPVFRPHSLHSGGLTNNPNINVPPLMAGNEATTTGAIDIAKLLAPFVAEGFIKADDDEVTMLSAINALLQDAKWSRVRKVEMQAQIASMRAAVPTAANEASHDELLQSLCSQVAATAANEAQHESDITAANEKAASAEARFTAARTARVESAVALLITQGYVTNANAGALRTELIEAANEADVDERLAELGKTKPRLGLNGGVTDNLKDAGKLIMAANERTARNRMRDEVVNECLAEITKGGAARPGDHEYAWNRARALRPELFNH
ncbi:MAG: phage protease [Prosthecobacter sp.]|uniref:hypothetical protein n=1 Tax=Prosthecobacter sp. TaxID=1965333 RepID=UPI0025E2F5FE|nr:hypothetical protein [Prosthecobacter sp.]MCF7785569.1 phage protease [Prosthecobacter sp.]